ncbi:MAG: hypothetical protein Q4G07_11315 [Oscillospiraceae bacterium]|nr:hypothetical protein [Oscillospiraceae bacterium]
MDFKENIDKKAGSQKQGDWTYTVKLVRFGHKNQTAPAAAEVKIAAAGAVVIKGMINF